MQRDYDRLVAQLDAQPARTNGHTPDGPAEPKVILRRASDIAMEPISWLWPGWLAAGKLHMLGGVPGTGKTTIALALAAIVSGGGSWPDGAPFRAPRHVLIWSGEDDAADTLVPRLSAMGGDLTRVHVVSSVSDPDGRRAFDPAHDMPALAAKAHEVGDVGLLIVDPVVMTVAGDSHKNGEVRRALSPLVTFAQELRAAVLGITHFSKGTSGKEPLDRLTGSLAFGAAPRVVLAASKTKGDDGKDTDARVFVRVKSNIGPDGGGFDYTLNTVELPQGITASRVRWGGAIEGNARDILADAEQTDAETDEESALAEATQCLRTILADGEPHEASDVSFEARSAGHAERTIRRAREALGIRPQRNGKTRKWYWRLPKQDGHDFRAINAGHLGPLTPNAHPAPHPARMPEQDGQGGHGSELDKCDHLTYSEVF